MGYISLINGIIKRRFSLSVIKFEMVRILNVAEKNDAAKSIAEIMSGGRYRKREGFSRFNKIYEFEYNILSNNCTMTMTSVSGHLLNLEFVGQYKKWYSCNPVALFDAQVQKYCPENYVDIKRTLEREIRGCSYLIIWTDCDREGENIGFEVIDVCKAVKPNIPVYRAKFSEITPEAIARACRNLGQADKNTSNAVDVRQELDLRIGAAFTRFQTLRLQKLFPAVLGEQLISYGSCQFPTLGFVVERYKQVQAFIPEPFWKLKVQHKVEDKAVEFIWKRNRLFDYHFALALYENCIENPSASVIDVQSKNKSKWRPLALDTVEMEKLASRKLHISAKETMQIAEKLYTKGFISYPRTETNIFPNEMNLVGLVQEQAQSPIWGDFANRVLQHGPQPRNGKKTDKAHPPIHPTKYTNSLTGNEAKLYEFIVRHFLACVSQDAQGFETTVNIDVAEEKFHVSGLMIIARNYLDVYPYEKWNAKEIPVYQQGDTFIPNLIELDGGETSAPPLLSEADLIALMDKHGIGTDATHAEHIETIKSRMYVGLRPDGRFVPGQLGMGLVEGYDNMGYEMSKPNLRAELEADLKLICEGKKNKDVVLTAHVQKYKAVFIEACKQALKIDQAVAQYIGEDPVTPSENTDATAAGFGGLDSMPMTVMKCPQCGQEMQLKSKKNNKGYYIGCIGYPTCRKAVWLPDSVVEAKVSDDTCPQCGPDVHRIEFKFKKGSVPPTISLEYIGCVGGCDKELEEALGIGNLARRPSLNGSSEQDSGFVSGGNTSRMSQIGGSTRSYSTNVANVAPIFSESQFRGCSSQNLTRGNYSQNVPRGNNSQNFSRGNDHENRKVVSNFQGNNNRTQQSNTLGASLPHTHNRTPQSSALGTSLSLSQSSYNSNMHGSPSVRPDNSRIPLSSVGNTRNNLPMSGKDNGNNETVCNCGNAAVLLTVKKEGPNKGRQFYKCSNSTCHFFLWADEAPSGDGGSKGQIYSSNPGGLSRNSGFQSSSNQNQGSATGIPNCNCEQEARCLTVQKEGPNKGRQFYGCSKPRDQSCGFFQWADEEGRGGSYNKGGGYGGRDSTGFKKVGTKRGATGERGEPKAKKGRKCGLCGEEGHTKPKCPHKGD
ncbi:hypothetical protein CHS0354_037368 [Potamilus streckersoni]|uniref:DNA topoisomerase n=1 Tax=Potamilus streckersoni TaxID=2493646 RepID=A0AAE0S4G4_9BIVA|nr:hypothetical protein CHS0354_037368 [Potamilus streckersoni]